MSPPLYGANEGDIRVANEGDVPVRLGEVLGEGGFGRVYRGTHVASGKGCAVKVLSPSTDAQSMASEVELLRSCRRVEFYS